MQNIITAKNALFTASTNRRIAREIAGGQGHFVEIIVGVVIVVVIAIFIYTSGVPGIEKLWNDAMSLIGTIKPK